MPTSSIPRRRAATSTVALLAITFAFAFAFAAPAAAQQRVTADDLDRRVAQVMPRVIEWRRDIHEHPELSGEEVRTAALVVTSLRAMGIEVREHVGGTGVLGVLRGGKPGGVVALRADMDALPVTEEVDLPFKSKVRTMYAGQEVGVMHACGHDAHTSMLLGAAQVLAGMKDQIKGTVVFIFQPAEESIGGAGLMIADGVMSQPKVDAVFGIHVWPELAGSITYKPGGAMAASNGLTITVHGKQTHGAQPWRGVDPIVVASQIVNALQTITARQTDVTVAPAVVTIATIHGGVRSNIIPDSVVMTGTIRTFDEPMRKDVLMRIKRIAESTAAGMGATATVLTPPGADLVYNDPALTARMASTIARVTGTVHPNTLWMPSEDFSEYQKKAPGVFYFLGVNKAGVSVEDAPANHSTRFFVNEDALPVGVKAYAALALDYLSGNK
jgi:amidohydrolase